VTTSLLETEPGTVVGVLVTTSMGRQGYPILTNPDRTEAGGSMDEGDAIVSVTAEVLDANSEGTGVFLPVEFPTTPCA
jgi:hypothetical protein